MLKKELLIYIIILVIAAVSMHPDLLNEPSHRFSQMQSMGNYSHPFIYSFVLYMIVGILRVITAFIKKLFTSKKSNESDAIEEN
jgi:uncharacterized integral membrane protein